MSLEVSRNFENFSVSCLQEDFITTEGKTIDDIYFQLIGTGVKPKICGSLRGSHVCELCGKVYYSRYTCKKRTCPSCYSVWAYHERNKILNRLLDEKAVNFNLGKKEKKKPIRHIIVFLPQRKYETIKDLNGVLREGYKYIISKGFRGGVAVFHSFRIKKEAKERAKAEFKSYWGWIREQENPWAWYYYSPHLHVVGYSDYLAKPTKDDLEIGYGYKQITYVADDDIVRPVNFDPAVRKGGIEDLKNLVSYELKHTSVIRNKKNFSCVRWIGNLTTRNLKTSDDETIKFEGFAEERCDKACSICGSRVVDAWGYIKRNGYLLMAGELVPEYVDEIINLWNGSDPPQDAKDYLFDKLEDLVE